jgi:hypothetical protein
VAGLTFFQLILIVQVDLDAAIPIDRVDLHSAVRGSQGQPLDSNTKGSRLTSWQVLLCVWVNLGTGIQGCLGQPYASNAGYLG